MEYKILYLNKYTGQIATLYTSGPDDRSQAASNFQQVTVFKKYFYHTAGELRISDGKLWQLVGTVREIPMYRVIGIHKVKDMVEFKEWPHYISDIEMKMMSFITFKKIGILL